jgi:hypothetical protein
MSISFYTLLLLWPKRATHLRLAAAPIYLCSLPVQTRKRTIANTIYFSTTFTPAISSLAVTGHFSSNILDQTFRVCTIRYHRALRSVPRADFFFFWELIFPSNAYHRHQFLRKSEEQFSMKTSDPRNRSDPVSWIWFLPTWCSHKHTLQSFLSGTQFCGMRKSKLCSAIALFLNAENPLREPPKMDGTGPFVLEVLITRQIC